VENLKETGKRGKIRNEWKKKSKIYKEIDAALR
jgi:hypothetical protein